MWQKMLQIGSGGGITPTSSLLSMTSSDGTASALYTYNSSSSYAPINAFDGNSSTIWTSPNGTSLPNWLQFAFNTKKCVTKIEIIERATYVSFVTTNVYLQVSNTGNNDDFTTISTLTLDASKYNTYQSYDIDNSNAWKFYRIKFTTRNCNQDSGYCTLSNIRMYGYEV